jgi:hypothetical protein
MDHRIIEILGPRPSNRLPVSYYKCMLDIFNLFHHYFTCTITYRYMEIVHYVTLTIDIFGIRTYQKYWSVNRPCLLQFSHVLNILQFNTPMILSHK